MTMAYWDSHLAAKCVPNAIGERALGRTQMREDVGRTPLDLLGHLVRGAGETEHQIGHASLDIRLNFLQTLSWGAQDAVAVNQMLKRLVVAA